MRLITLMFLLIAPTLSLGKVWDRDARLSNLGSINISIIDDTDGGCWTNISEVRSYVVGKLEIAGATISEDRSNQWKMLEDKLATIRIYVGAVRTDAGFCVGSMSIIIGGSCTKLT